MNADAMNNGTPNKYMQKIDIINNWWASPDVTDISDMFEPAPARTEETLFIMIHHDAIFAEPNKPMPIAEIKAYHLQKFGNFAYHFYVLPNGKIYKTQNANAKLPHAIGCNNNAVAICLHGNFDLQLPAKLQMQNAARLAAELQMQFPNAKIVGHSDKNATTSCPGANLDIAEIQHLIATKHYLIYGVGN